MVQFRRLSSLVLITSALLLAREALCAEREIRAPSEQMKQAVGKLTKTPATIGKSLQDLTEAAKAKLKQAFGDEAKPNDKARQVDLDVPRKNLAARPVTPSALKEIGRDPFRPMTLGAKGPTRRRENLSPLERFDLSQLKLVGIVWDIKEPRALVEDNAGLGYVVGIGTPIGNHDGQIKAIRHNQIVVEETDSDAYGKPRKRTVSMKLLTQ